jgi:LIVCS family branched-chain amino acid:cation transporter
MLVSLLFGMVDAIKGSSLGHVLPDAVSHLPLSAEGLAWLVPSVLTLGVAVVCDRMLGRPREALA